VALSRFMRLTIGGGFPPSPGSSTTSGGGTRAALSPGRPVYIALHMTVTLAAASVPMLLDS
jgi:hypothetical protein